MLTILLLSLNVVLLQGIPVGQERVSRERRQDNVDEFNECTLPERLDPFGRWKNLFTYLVSFNRAKSILT